MEELEKIDKIEKIFEENQKKIEKYKSKSEMDHLSLKMLMINTVIYLLIFFTNNEIFFEKDKFMLAILYVICTLLTSLLISIPFFKKLGDNHPISVIVFIIPIALAGFNINYEFVSGFLFSSIIVTVGTVFSIINSRMMIKETMVKKKLIDENIKLMEEKKKIVDELLQDKAIIKQLNNHVCRKESHVYIKRMILDLFLKREKESITVDSILAKEKNNMINI